MKHSKISWTDHTFNPWWGCVKVSPACTHCYAEKFAKRTGHSVWGVESERRTFGEKHWRQPLKWNAEAAKTGLRRRVFCASMADVFEDHPTAAAERTKLWRLIGATPNLDWLLLSKRPENMMKMLPGGRSPENVWLGTTVESQQYAQERLPHLLAVPAKVHFVSAEPLLESIDLTPWLATLDWLIVGGESGAGFRPFDPDWARSLKAQCRANGTAFFMKQMNGLSSRKAAEEVPKDLQVQQFPGSHWRRC